MVVNLVFQVEGVILAIFLTFSCVPQSIEINFLLRGKALFMSLISYKREVIILTTVRLFPFVHSFRFTLFESMTFIKTTYSVYVMDVQKIKPRFLSCYAYCFRVEIIRSSDTYEVFVFCMIKT